MKDSDRKALISDLRTVAQLYFDGILQQHPDWNREKKGLCYYLDKVTTHDYQDYSDPCNPCFSVYGVITDLMESLSFTSMYFEGKRVTEPFETRAYMALILAEYLKQGE